MLGREFPLLLSVYPQTNYYKINGNISKIKFSVIELTVLAFEAADVLVLLTC